MMGLRKMEYFVFVLFVPLFGFTSSDIIDGRHSGRALTVHDVEITTITSFVEVTKTSTIVLPSCTYYVSTSSVTKPCIYLNIGVNNNNDPRRLRLTDRSDPTNSTTLTSGAEDLLVNLDSSLRSISTDEGEARILIPAPDFTNVVTLSVYTTNLFSSTTTLTIATVTSTFLLIMSIPVNGIDADTGGAVPRCAA